MKPLTIKEIEEKLFDNNREMIDEELMVELQRDGRKGVQKLLKRYEKEKQKEYELKQQFKQMSIHEQRLKEKGYQNIAGVDEVGRGPLAGPVVAAAVILPDDFYLLGINDSKKLSEKKREEFYEKIVQEATSIGIGLVQADEIDRLNIYQATKKAMKAAVLDLHIQPDYLLIDAMDISVKTPQQKLIKGDSLSVSIAASSIVAKVTRDRMMKKIGKKYPQYGFEHHMGYGTSSHLKAIEKYGVIDIHRRTFTPIKEKCSS